MRRIAITGIAGYVGSQLLAKLASHCEVETIVGLDLRPPAWMPPRLRFFPLDIRQPLAHLLEQERVDTLVHLAFVVRPARNQAWASSINVRGSLQVMEAARFAGVSHLVYLGSSTAYGAHRDNPVPLMESAPLRPNPRFQYSRDKAYTDGLFQQFALANPSAKVTVLRGCVVLGPMGQLSVGARMFTPFMVRIAGHDPPVQYVHEEDLTRVLLATLELGISGTFNIAGDGTLPYSRTGILAGRRMVPLPRSPLGGLLDLTWKLGLQSESTSAGLDFIAHPWVTDNSRFKRAAKYSYRYSSEDAVRAFVGR